MYECLQQHLNSDDCNHKLQDKSSIAIILSSTPCSEGTEMHVLNPTFADISTAPGYVIVINFFRTSFSHLTRRHIISQTILTGNEPKWTLKGVDEHILRIRKYSHSLHITRCKPIFQPYGCTNAIYIGSVAWRFSCHVSEYTHNKWYLLVILRYS